MDELYKLGISDNTIKGLLEMYPNLKEITEKEIIAKEQILEKIGCSNIQMVNIISSNVMWLDRTNESIIELLVYLSKLGFTVLSILLDANPYILNLEIFEIENYIKVRLSNKETLENIVDDLDSNPYLFNEI